MLGASDFVLWLSTHKEKQRTHFYRLTVRFFLLHSVTSHEQIEHNGKKNQSILFYQFSMAKFDSEFYFRYD